MIRTVPIQDLYALRLARGYTNAAVLAAQVGISLTLYRRIEEGKSNPSVPVFRRLAKVLHVSQARLRGEVAP